MARVLGVIPARYGSQRFPGKVIAKLGSWPMIRYVYEAAKKSKTLDHLVIGTDDERVLEEAKAFGAECLMTSEEHKTGTDRLTEVADYYKDFDVIVNIQGDEPGIETDLIDGVVKLKLDHPEWEAATAARPFQEDEDPLQPNRVKVAISKKSRALYFSRSLIPFPRNTTGFNNLLHLGIYAYQRDFLMRFKTLPVSHLEDTESLEQLRILENDYDIGVHIVEGSMPGVDTEDDLNAMIALLKSQGKLQ